MKESRDAPIDAPEGGEVKSKTVGSCAWRLAGKLGVTVVSWREGTKKAHFHGLVFVTWWSRGESNSRPRMLRAKLLQV